MHLGPTCHTNLHTLRDVALSGKVPLLIFAHLKFSLSLSMWKSTECPLWLQLIPVLRAGLVLLESAQTVLPAAVTYHVGYVRDEKTLEVRIMKWKFSRTDMGNGSERTTHGQR